MGQGIQDAFNLLSTGILQRYFSRDSLNFADYSVLAAHLVRNGIPFDTKFTPGNARNETECSVTIYLSPKVTLTISFSDLALTDAP